MGVVTVRRFVVLIHSVIQTMGLNFWGWHFLLKSRKCGPYSLMEGSPKCGC